MSDLVPLGIGEPTSRWSIDKCTRYAAAINAVLHNEKVKGKLYFLMGKALIQIRPNFVHGEWMKHLKSVGINRNVAQRAMQLFSAHKDDGVDSVDGKGIVALLVPVEGTRRRQSDGPWRKDGARCRK